MHIQAFLSAVILGICFQVSANAAVKCVALHPGVQCSSGASAVGKVGWSATCNGMPVTGLGVCSSEKASVGDIRINIATSGMASANASCWCKMTSPAVSRFVFLATFSSPELCSNGCAEWCMDGVGSSPTMRDSLFYNFVN